MTQISAKVVAHSKNYYTDKEIVTFEVIYPRYILPEVLTHRVFSRNTSSSRAVPPTKLQYTKEMLVEPSHWGKNQAGMQANGELEGTPLRMSKLTWKLSRALAFSCHKMLTSLGGHKQWVNRIIEPYIYTKQLITATEWDNFFELRDHPAAQPEIQILAKKMKDALAASTPQVLTSGQWHLPYIKMKNGKYYQQLTIADVSAITGSGEAMELTLQDAIAISISACAQISYRQLDLSLAKAKKIFGMLNFMSTTEPIHASPLEHQATPIAYRQQGGFVEEDPGSNEWHMKWPAHPMRGVTYLSRNGQFWSSNFCEWSQLRNVMEEVIKAERAKENGGNVAFAVGEFVTI